jgi:hypothetical protein
MNPTKAQEIFAELLINAAGVLYGSVSVTFKLHEGKVVEVTYLTSKQTKKPKSELTEKI